MMIDARIRMGGGLSAVGVPRLYAIGKYHPLSMGRLSAGTQSIAGMIQTTASQLGVPPSLALAVAQHESGLNQAAVGSAGEIGVFQLMPSTAAGLGVDPTDLQQNITGGVTYLKQMYQLTGNWSDALVAYNEGPGRWSSGTVVPASADYASSILAAAGLPADASSGSTDQVATDTGSTGDQTPATVGQPAVSAPLLIAAAVVGLLWLTG